MNPEEELVEQKETSQEPSNNKGGISEEEQKAFQQKLKEDVEKSENLGASLDDEKENSLEAEKELEEVTPEIGPVK